MKANRFRKFVYFVYRAAMLISLLLTVLSSGLWIRGSSYADFVQLAIPSKTIIYVNGGSYLFIVWIYEKDPDLPPVEKYEFRTGTHPTEGKRSAWPPLDFFNGSTDLDPSLATQYNIAIQWWAMVLCFGLFPLWRMSIYCIRFLKRRHRRTRGLCTRCGYDLRASRERCPECGQEINGQKEKTGQVSNSLTKGDP
jgi:hypothetical protein